MARKKKKASNLIHRAKTRAHRSHTRLLTQFPHVSATLERLGVDLKDIRRHSAKVLSAAAIASGMITTAPIIPTALHQASHEEHQLSADEIAQRLQEDLKPLLPEHVGGLKPEVETEISIIFQRNLRMKAVPILDGNRLNTTFGRIGGEQHLPRYLGDRIEDHDELQVKGITKNRGAFGYFAKSKADLSPEDIQKEKYYVAVQTMYLPEWNQQHKTLKEWYKFRKVLVVNPTNGRSVVAVVGDAGPAAWTGKHFGGSPEVMAHLEPYKENNNGKVLLFFIDDVEHPVALGPVKHVGTQFLAQK